MAQQKVKILIPTGIKPLKRIAIGKDIIDFIQSRSARGNDKDNKKFGRYTKPYAKKKGTSRSNVDLILSGEMLEAMKILKHKSGEITIGYSSKDKKNNGKAEGNQLGTYGQSKQVTKPRKFLGITPGHLSTILKANNGS